MKINYYFLSLNHKEPHVPHRTSASLLHEVLCGLLVITSSHETLHTTGVSRECEDPSKRGLLPTALRLRNIKAVERSSTYTAGVSLYVPLIEVSIADACYAYHLFK